VEDLLEELGLLRSAMTFGLLFQDHEEVDRVSGLAQLLPNLLGHGVGDLSEVDQDRTGQHQEKPGQFRPWRFWSGSPSGGFG